jgi:hypothetical protein
VDAAIISEQDDLASTNDYRRQARRIRHELRGKPAKLHRTLRYLSACHDMRQAQQSLHAPTSSQFHEEPDDNVRTFAHAVAARMRGPILQYSQRLELMKQAKDLSLNHFDANLIIAAVQHRMKGDKVPETRSTRSWFHTMVLAAMLQISLISLIALLFMYS